MKETGTQETAIQADDDAGRYRFFLVESNTALTAFSKVLGRLFNYPNKSSKHNDSIRNSKKGFKLNDPAAFNESLAPQRYRIPARAILPPLSQIDTETFTTRSDKEEEVFQCPNETVVKVYVDGPEAKEEFMKVYIDNEPTQLITQDEESEWRYLPLKKKAIKHSVRTHFTGDGCKLRDPCARGQQILSLQKLIKGTGRYQLDRFEVVVSEDTCDKGSQFSDEITR